MIVELFKSLGIDLPSVLGGMAGRLIAVIHEADVTVKRVIMQVFVGGIVAGYVMPFIQQYTGMGLNLQNFISFMIGYSAPLVLGYMNKYIKQVSDVKTKNLKNIGKDDV